MSTLALWMLIVFGVLTFVVRATIQLIKTGTTGLIGYVREGPVGWLSGVAFTAGMALGAVSVVRVHAGSLGTIHSIDTDALHVVGILLAGSGGLTVFLAQLGMGASWRIGVSEDQDTALVTGGWFSIVRNPIYSAMVVGWTGLALMVPTWLAFAAPILVALGLELQVRLVEEPFLLRHHGDAFHAYARRVGRFVPGIGRFS